MNQDFMKTKKVFPLVLSMSYPMVLSMLVSALYNIVDSYFVAKISEEAMTAISLVYPLQNLIVSVGVGFGIGINAIVAFYNGAGEIKKAANAVSQGIILNTLHGGFLTVFCMTFIPYFLRLFTDNQAIIEYGLEYSDIVFLFSISITVGVTYEKIFQSVGKMKVSMLCMSMGCIINIILDPLMIFGIGFFPKMGVKGAALATGIGQLVTLLMYLIIFAFSSLPIKQKIDKGLFNDNVYKKMYSIGIPATLNMALPSILIAALNGILSSFSEVYVLILGVYYKLQTFIYLTANGIVQGIRPLISFNYGAGEHKRVRLIFKTALVLGIIIMSFGTILCLTVPQQLIGLFSDSSETIAEGAKALTIISRGFIVSSLSVMICGTFEALGKGVPSLLISIMRYVMIIPIAFILSRFYSANGVWNAFWITEVAASAVSAVMYIKLKRNIKI